MCCLIRLPTVNSDLLVPYHKVTEYVSQLGVIEQAIERIG
jgi:hypothetical protein